MKKVTIILLGAVVAGLAVAAAILGLSCISPEARYDSSQAQPQLSMRSRAEAISTSKAHGGTHNVNDAAFDAMFFKNYGVNPFVDSDDDRLSTFAVDVDTGSYTLARSYLNRNALPEEAAVRVEEFVNYFDYGYAPPRNEGEAFAIHLAGRE